MKTNKLVNCPQCGGFGFTSTPVSKNYGTTVCRAKTCELCHGAGVIEAPMTNADRIRAMSDEELAVLIAREIVHVPHSGFYVAKSAWLRWLQETVEEDDHA